MFIIRLFRYGFSWVGALRLGDDWEGGGGRAE